MEDLRHCRRRVIVSRASPLQARAVGIATRIVVADVPVAGALGRDARTLAQPPAEPYPLVMDVEGTVAERYQALALPVHYWIDRDGIVRDWAFGELPPALLAASLDVPRS